MNNSSDIKQYINDFFSFNSFHENNTYDRINTYIDEYFNINWSKEMWPSMNMDTILYDTGIDPQCVFANYPQNWIFDQPCNNWYFMICSFGFLFDLFIDFSFLHVEINNFQPYTRDFLCLISDWDIAKTFFICPQLNVFILNYIYINSNWCDHIFLIFKYSNYWYYWFQFIIVTNIHHYLFISKLQYILIYIIGCFSTLYDFCANYYLYYGIRYKLLASFFPLIQWYLYWMFRCIMPYYLWIFLLIFMFFYMLHYLYEPLWYEGIGYWMEYFQLRIWRRLERSFFATYELNGLYSLLFNRLYKRRSYTAFGVYLALKNASFKQYIREFTKIWNSKNLFKASIAVEWYSLVEMRRVISNSEQLGTITSLFFIRLIFMFLWSWYTIFCRVVLWILIRYAAILRILHFYFYGIFYGMLWCCWIFSRENCYKLSFLS